jgi:Domain of unknown function (DUF4116)
MSDLRARLNKITELHGQTLAEAVAQREPMSKEAQLPPKDLVLRFAGADPTPGKSRTQWLIKTYILDERFKLEDLGRVDAALAAFERFKRKLPVEQRELSRLKSLRELETLVDPFVKAEERARLTRDLSSATGREKRRLEEWKARDESIIVQEGKGLPTIAVPMTEFAAKWWGRGTKWCTAAEKDNMFTQYHKDAPLIVIVCPDGEKFQMYVKSDTFQFMDNTDENVSKEIRQKRWNDFQSLLYWSIPQNGDALEYVPEEYKTYELCLLAVQQNGRALYYVPEEYKTPELCSSAIKQDGQALYNVPENKRTPDLYLLAVQQNGMTLEFVQEITYELCRLAIEKNGQALQFVPEKERTLELCRLAVEQNGIALRFVPKYYTHELYDLAVQQDGHALKYVPEEDRTPELCYIAIQPDGRALQYVPVKQKTPELCRLAIEQDGQALDFVPPEQRTSKLCRIAVEQNGNALYYVPTRYRTPDLCRLAIERNGQALNAVPEQHQTLELCRIVIARKGFEINDIPEELQTPELMALIPPSQPKWHPDILQGLGRQSKLSQEAIYPVSL